MTRSGLVEKHDGDLDPQLSVRLWLRLLSATMVVEKRIRRRFADQFGTTLPRFDILAALDRRGAGMTMSELSRALLVSNGNVTSLVQALTRDGYVETEPSPTDGRVSVVGLTPAGRRYFATMADAHSAWIETMFAGMNSGQRSRLYDLLGHVKISLALEDRS